MWLGLGLITLLLSIVAALLLRARSAWVGVRHEYRSGEDPALRAYEQQLLRSKQRNRGYRLGVRGSVDFDFEIRTETAFDRFAKRLGVAREQATGDAVFDERYYIESDDARVGLALRDSPEARRRIGELFDHAARGGHKPNRLRVRGGRLWLEASGSAGLPGSTQGAALADHLYALRRALAAHACAPGRVVDRFVGRAAILLAISSGLAITAVLALFRLGNGRTEVLDPWTMAVTLAVFVLPATLLLLVLAMRFMRNSARAHRVLVELATLGAFGAVVCGMALLREVNVAFDTAPAQWSRIEAARAVHTTRRCGRRNRRTCHDYFLYAAWPPALSPSGGRLRLDEGQYRELDGHASLEVGVRPGLLGFPWVEEIRVASGARDLER